MSHSQLVIVAVLIKFVRISTTLLQTKVIIDGPHEDLLPLWEGAPGGKPGVKVEETLVTGTCKISSPDCTLPHYFIKSRLGIKEEGKNSVFRGENRVLNGFSQK